MKKLRRHNLQRNPPLTWIRSAPLSPLLLPFNPFAKSPKGQAGLEGNQLEKNFWRVSSEVKTKSLQTNYSGQKALVYTRAF